MSEDSDKSNRKSFLRSLFPFGKSKKDGKHQTEILASKLKHSKLKLEEEISEDLSHETNNGEFVEAVEEGESQSKVADTNTEDLSSETDALSNEKLEKPIFSFVEYASFVNDLPGKGHDKVSISRLEDGSLLAILCDGVGSLGHASAVFAEALTITLDDYFSRKFDPTNDSFAYWTQFVSQALNWSIEQIALEDGATTLIMIVIPEGRQHMYISWLGDGNLIYYTKDLTGYAKILYPHHNGTKQLTKAISAKGIVGEPSCIVMNPDPGYLILSSDGYTLLSAKYLRHFLIEVLRKDNLEEALDRWGNEECCENVDGKHHDQLDDQSIVVLRW